MWKSVPLALALVSLSACSDMCGNDVMARADAPGGDHSAVMFERSCGATTGYSTQISIVDPGEQPSGGGNAFVAEDVEAKMKWLTPDHLLILHTATPRIYEQDDEVSGVRISYRIITR